MRLVARAVALLSAKREVEQLHAGASNDEEKECELDELHSKAERLEDKATTLSSECVDARSDADRLWEEGPQLQGTLREAILWAEEAK